MFSTEKSIRNGETFTIALIDIQWYNQHEIIFCGEIKNEFDK